MQASVQRNGQLPVSLASGWADSAQRRRSRMDICFDLLDAVWTEGTIGPTRLMYRTNLSWNMMTQMIDELVRRGLLVTKSTGVRHEISISQLGTECLQRLHEARRALFSDGRMTPSSAPGELPRRVLLSEERRDRSAAFSERTLE